jgi:hypothetical protein
MVLNILYDFCYIKEFNLAARNDVHYPVYSLCFTSSSEFQLLLESQDKILM